MTTKLRHHTLRSLLALLAALAMTGVFAPNVGAAPIDDLVACIPSELVACPDHDPEPDPDPGPAVPWDGPGDLTDCQLDPVDFSNPCDDDDDGGFDPGGPGDLTDCGLDENGNDTCDDGDDGGGGDGGNGGGGDGGGSGGSGIDRPVPGTPTFTG